MRPLGYESSLAVGAREVTQWFHAGIGLALEAAHGEIDRRRFVDHESAPDRRTEVPSVDVTDARRATVTGRLPSPKKRSINGDPGNGLSFPERVSENRPKVRTFPLVPCEDEREMGC